MNSWHTVYWYQDGIRVLLYLETYIGNNRLLHRYPHRGIGSIFQSLEIFLYVSWNKVHRDHLNKTIPLPQKIPGGLHQNLCARFFLIQAFL